MTITFFEHVVKCAQRDVIAEYHKLDGSTEHIIISKAHSLEHLRDNISEAIGYILYPGNYYYAPDYPDGFPENYL